MAPALLASARRFAPWLRHVFADGGYAGNKLKNALKEHGDWTIEIVKRSDAAKGFVLLPRRWVVERTIAWLNRNRRLAKDVEILTESAVTWLYIASVKLMSRRLATRDAPSGFRWTCVPMVIRVRWGDWGLSPVIRWLLLSG